MVGKMEQVAHQLIKSGVVCKAIYGNEPYNNFIAVFGLGTMTEEEINAVIKSNGLYCIFQRSCYEKYDKKK